LGVVLFGSLTLFAGGAQATEKQTPYATGRVNAGTPNSTTVVKDKDGSVSAYGNGAITYTLPSAALAADGQALYEQNCASCHGDEANGQPDDGTPGTFPDLRDVGPATVDFWIESGRMPAKDPRNVEAIRKVPVLNHRQALEIAAWIDSLTATPSYPYIPTPNLTGGSVAEGASLFALNCAACHTITGDGDALAFGTYAPSLRHVPAIQVTEAIRTGPGNMPRFTGNLSDDEVRDIVKYVTGYIEHPKNPGGLGLGGLGPVAEGFVGLALGVGLLALAAFWIGERE
jgi:ubiquinol-cytochrome c reductase cytochrome c subunit